MKQNVRPPVLILLAVIAVAVLGLLGYRVFTGTPSGPQAAPRPSNPTDARYKPNLPAGIGGGGQ